MVQCRTCSTICPTTLLLWQPRANHANVRISSRPGRPAKRAAWRTGNPQSSRPNGEGQNMDPQTLIIWLVIGAVAGWLAGQIMKGGGFGLVGDIVVGIIGSVVAGWLLPRVGISIGGGIIAEVINALIGAVILLFIVRLVKR